MTQKEKAILDQNKKFNQLVDLKESGEKILRISGPAGVGKTYLASKIIKKFKQPNDIVVCTAISHQATNQLTNSLRKDASLRSLEAQTAASVMDHRPIYNDDGTSYFDYKPKYDYSSGRKVLIPPLISEADFIVFDECSQISSDFLSKILKLKKRDSLLIFLGDICQTPPISGEKYSPTFDFPGVELSIPFRYEGEIQAFSFLIREEILKGLDEKPFNFSVWKEFLNRKNLTDIQFYNEPGPFLNACLRDMEQYEGIHDIKYISYRKNQYRKTSQWLRKKINPLKYDFEPGDIIVSKQNYYDEAKKAYVLNNSQNGKILKKITLTGYISWIRYSDDLRVFQTIIPSYGKSKTKLKGQLARDANVFNTMVELEEFKYLAVDIKTDDDEVKFVPIKILTSDVIEGALAEIKEGNYFDYEEYYNKWVPHGLVQNFVCKIEYAYGVNVHVCQGSTYKKTYVSLDDIFSVGPINKLQKLQAFYVAITRATDEVKIYYKNKNYK